MTYVVIFNAQRNFDVQKYIFDSSCQTNGAKINDFLDRFNEDTKGTSLVMVVNENLKKFAPEKTSMRNAVAYKINSDGTIDFEDCAYGPGSYPLYSQPRLFE